MALIIALAFGFIIWHLSKSFRRTIENIKYPHRTCPFCGSDVIGHKDYVAINGNSLVNYNCTNCGAYNNASSSIWYRKKGNGSSDLEIRQGS